MLVFQGVEDDHGDEDDDEHAKKKNIWTLSEKCIIMHHPTSLFIYRLAWRYDLLAALGIKRRSTGQTEGGLSPGGAQSVKPPRGNSWRVCRTKAKS